MTQDRGDTRAKRGVEGSDANQIIIGDCWYPGSDGEGGDAVFGVAERCRCWCPGWDGLSRVGASDRQGRAPYLLSPQPTEQATVHRSRSKENPLRPGWLPFPLRSAQSRAVSQPLERCATKTAFFHRALDYAQVASQHAARSTQSQHPSRALQAAPSFMPPPACITSLTSPCHAGRRIEIIPLNRVTPRTNARGTHRWSI